jgi:hypothetical protein
MSQPVTYTVPAVETNFGTDLVDETPISVFDAGMLSKVTRGLGTPTTLGEDIIRNLHTMLIQTVDMISTILLLMIQKLFQK